MRISLFFPLLYLAIRKTRPAIVLPVAVLSSLFADAMGRQQPKMENFWSTVSYIGIFGCGVLIEEHYETICRWYRRLNGLERPVFALVSFILYSEGHRLRLAPFVWRLEEWSVVGGAELNPTVLAFPVKAGTRLSAGLLLVSRNVAPSLEGPVDPVPLWPQRTR